MNDWSFYIIKNGNATYAGVSPDPIQRLRKHNGEIAGGAKYTLSRGPGWEHVCLVHGFRNKIESMQFEWAVKHVPPRNAGGIENRIKKLYSVLNKDKWTSKSPNAHDVPLHLEWIEPKYKVDDELPSYVTCSMLPLPHYQEQLNHP